MAAPALKAPPPATGKAPPKGKAPPPPKRGPPPPKAGSGAVRAPAYDGPKLRPLFWSSIKALQIPSESVWGNLVPPAPFDQTQLERQFALTESRPIASARKGSNVEESRKRLRVLDDRTSELLAIAFHKLPPPEQLVAVVDSLDDFPEGLPAQAVCALHTASADQREAVEQLRQLVGGGSDLTQLELPERYLWLLGSAPSFAAKVACGALIAGPARELWELQQANAKVRRCCREFREKLLVQKCISTSLAVGNLLNRGTTRSNVQALVLPDSLLKLDELRGIRSVGADSPTEERSPTLLDFVAQALVDEPGAKDSKQLRTEAWELRESAMAGKSVSLDEADDSCKKVCAEAERAWASINGIPRCAHVDRIAEKVGNIKEQASHLKACIAEARNELLDAQRFLSAKAKVTSDDWLGGWSLFFEQLAEAFARTRPPRAPTPGKKVPSENMCPFAPKQHPAPQREPLRESNVLLQRGTAPPVKGAKMMDAEGAHNAVQQSMAPAPRSRVTFDEEARAEDIMALLAKGSAGKLPADKAQLGTHDKENMPWQR